MGSSFGSVNTHGGIKKAEKKTPRSQTEEITTKKQLLVSLNNTLATETRVDNMISNDFDIH